jgi:hypothetical protein
MRDASPKQPAYSFKSKLSYKEASPKVPSGLYQSLALIACLPRQKE